MLPLTGEGGGERWRGWRQHIIRAILHVPLIGILIRIKVNSWRFTEETLSAAFNSHSQVCYRGRGWGRGLPAAYCTRNFTCTTDWDPYKDQGPVVTFYGGNALCSQRLTPTHRCVTGGGDGGGGCRQHIVRAFLHVPLIGILIRIKVQSWRFTEEMLSAASV